jgi:hypothetical protein
MVRVGVGYLTGWDVSDAAAAAAAGVAKDIADACTVLEREYRLSREEGTGEEKA